MSGYYPDGMNQALYDQYWNERLDEDEDEVDNFSWDDDDDLEQ